MSEKDKANLLAIFDSCSKIQKFTEEIWDADALFTDEKTFDAVLMNFVLIGEAVARLSEKLKLEQHQIPWTQIKGFRNIVVHDYFGVDAEEVWQIINSKLPELEKGIKEIIEFNSDLNSTS
ncbi:MAG: DUF86 domain-containing protein [Saprospiraceae bacterium]|nr:DUF86 domain-containing protein [Saprospiraceae bacterium]MBK7810619.1 DUF86 domain-containing protein [Saprospiraceae bacterium]MBK9630211.1 DUF86 domain-containing protein [Saprospiraceae bacterium]